MNPEVIETYQYLLWELYQESDDQLPELVRTCILGAYESLKQVSTDYDFHLVSYAVTLLYRASWQIGANFGEFTPLMERVIKKLIDQAIEGKRIYDATQINKINK